MFANFPEFLRTRWLQKTHRHPPNCSGWIRVSTMGWWFGGVGKAQSENTSSIVLILSRLATTPGCTIEVTRNQINVLRDHKSTNSLDNFLGAIPLFLAKTLLMCNDKTVKAVWPLDAVCRKEARDTTPCKTHPCSPSTK